MLNDAIDLLTPAKDGAMYHIPRIMTMVAVVSTREQK